MDKLWIWGGQNLGIEDKVWTNLRQGQSFDKMWTCLGQKLDKIWTWTKFGHNLVDLHCQLAPRKVGYTAYALLGTLQGELKMHMIVF